mgnify:CR=1 FL=1
MRVTVGMLKEYLNGIDENLEVVVYNDYDECDTFLYGAPVVCTIDEFRYCQGDSVAYEEEEDKLYCYFGK